MIGRITLVALLLTVHAGFAAEIFVAPAGNDHNAGTKDAPLATVAAALRKARELRRVSDPSGRDGGHIILRGGGDFLDEPIFVRPEDSGTEGSPTVIEAAPGETPVLGGGVPVEGWKRSGKLWEARCAW